jgi:hypothetical protein
MGTTPNATTYVTPIGRVALAYAEEFEMHVFPCAYGTKAPLSGSRGHLDATRDASTIRRLFAQRSRLNVAVNPRASGLVVLDVDVRNGGDETLASLEREHGRLPDTPRVLSGSQDGSTHFFFRDPGAVRFPARLGPGVDVKHDGYTLLPPSRHASGGFYRWDAGADIRESTIAPCPSWFLAPARRRPTPLGTPTGSAAETFLGTAFIAAGWAGNTLPAGKLAVRCPWADSHSDGRGRGSDSSTVILPATTELRLGAFRCAHEHCAARRAEHVLGVLPKRAIALAFARFPRALGSLAWRLAQSPTRTEER